MKHPSVTSRHQRQARTALTVVSAVALLGLGAQLPAAAAPSSAAAHTGAATAKSDSTKATSTAKKRPDVRQLCADTTAKHVAKCYGLQVVGPKKMGIQPHAEAPNGYRPADLRSAYNLPKDGGAGQTIAIVDDSRAVIAVAGRGGERLNLILVRPSGLLDSLIGLFESYWQMSIPLRGDGLTDTEGREAQTRRLLAYLSAGLTDESIAREMGVSERTVGRRIASLQERLGARSRFQLAVQATQRGWL